MDVFVEQTGLPETGMSAYLNTALDIDALRLYSLLSYVSETNNQRYCLGALDDFVRQFNFDIAIQNSLNKLYLYRYISLIKTKKQLIIKLYKYSISTCHFNNIDKQYIKFISSTRFVDFTDQYQANQWIREIESLDKTESRDSTFLNLKADTKCEPRGSSFSSPIDHANTKASDATFLNLEGDTKCEPRGSSFSSPIDHVNTKADDATFLNLEGDAKCEPRGSSFSNLPDTTKTEARASTFSNSFDATTKDYGQNHTSGFTLDDALTRQTIFKNSIYPDNEILKSNSAPKSDFKNEFDCNTYNRNKYQQDIIINKINILNSFDQKLCTSSIDTNSDDFYNGFTHTGNVRTAINQTSVNKNNKNQKTTTTTHYCPIKPSDVASVDTVSSTQTVQGTENASVVVVVDDHLDSVKPIQAQQSLPQANERKHYDVGDINWSILNSECQGFVFNNIKKARLNLMQAQRIVNVLVHKTKTNSTIMSLPAFLAKLIQSAKDETLFDPIQSKEQSQLDKTGANKPEQNMGLILRNHHIDYDSLIERGQNQDAQKYLIEHGLQFDGKRIYFQK